MTLHAFPICECDMRVNGTFAMCNVHMCHSHEFSVHERMECHD